MAIRKNKKTIDPRYFLNETTYRDLNEQEMKISDLAARYGDMSRDRHPVIMIGPNAFVRLSQLGPAGQKGVALHFSARPDMSSSSLEGSTAGDPTEFLIKGITSLIRKGSNYGIEIPQTDTVKIVG